MSEFPWKTAGLVLVTALCTGVVASAQGLLQINEAEQVRRMNQLEVAQPLQPMDESVPSLYPGEEKDTGRQLLLQATPVRVWSWFNAGVDSQYFYTSNSFLSNTAVKGTGLLVNTLTAEFTPPPINMPNGQLFIRTGYQYEWFTYGIGGQGNNVSLLDFDSSTLYGESRYVLPDQWSILGNIAYTRLLDDGNGYNEFYKELVPTIQVQKTFDIREGLRATLTYSGNYRVTDEGVYPSQSRGANNRTDQALAAALSWQVTPRVTVLPFYRFQYSYYPDYLSGQDRNDFLHTLGITANYSINSWVSVRLFVSYELRDSSMQSIANYRKLDAGAGVAATWKF
jgi:hypothetical protein